MQNVFATTVILILAGLATLATPGTALNPCLDPAQSTLERCGVYMECNTQNPVCEVSNECNEYGVDVMCGCDWNPWTHRCDGVGPSGPIHCIVWQDVVRPTNKTLDAPCVL